MASLPMWEIERWLTIRTKAASRVKIQIRSRANRVRTQIRNPANRRKIPAKAVRRSKQNKRPAQAGRFFYQTADHPPGTVTQNVQIKSLAA